MEEVVNITENPSVILADFDKEYLRYSSRNYYFYTAKTSKIFSII